MEVSATEKFEYAGRQIMVGDTFDCEANDVRLLSDLGWIRVQTEKQEYKTRDMSAKRRKAA